LDKNENENLGLSSLNEIKFKKKKNLNEFLFYTHDQTFFWGGEGG
jgi:hypothetical protein